jgi:DNA-binding MarR family transcriptional regulator
MTRAYQPFLEKHNLTYPQYIVMLAMFEHKKIDFKELSELVELKTGTLTPIVTKLEKMELIQKEKNSKDSRKINIVLTEKGEELNKEIIDVPIGLASELGISEEMYHMLTKELDQLSQILKTTKKEKK